MTFDSFKIYWSIGAMFYFLLCSDFLHIFHIFALYCGYLFIYFFNKGESDVFAFLSLKQSDQTGPVKKQDKVICAQTSGR